MGGLSGASLRIGRRDSGGSVAVDMNWVTERIALGGAIWDERGMMHVVGEGITHIIDMQAEHDDSELGRLYLVDVCWNPTDDDFEPKPVALFRRGVAFAREALRDESAKLYIHCAAGVHRAPLMTLAVLCALGWEMEHAMRTIEQVRPEAEFVDVYVESVKQWLLEDEG